MFNKIELDLNSIFNECEEIIERLKKNGIKLNNSSRFYRFYSEIKVISESLDMLAIDQIRNSEEFMEGFRDYFELRGILKSDNIYINANKDLKHVLGGCRLSHADKNFTARNYQYQLFLGALFEESGFHVSYKEPDLVIRHKGEEYCVAAKRISSIEKISRRISEAEKQIIKCNKKGIIAISLDFMINKFESFIDGQEADELYNKAEYKLESFVRSNSRHEWFTRNENIVGIIFTLIVPIRVNGKNYFGSAFSAIFVPMDSINDVNYRIMEEIAQITVNRSC